MSDDRTKAEVDFDAMMREAVVRAASEPLGPRRWERVLCPCSSKAPIPSGSVTRVAMDPAKVRWIPERLMVSRAGSVRAPDELPARGPDGHVALVAKHVVTALFRNGEEIWRDPSGHDSLAIALAKHRLDVEVGDVIEIEVRNDGPDAMLYASIAGVVGRASEA